jgi:DNA repair protein RadC
MEGNPRIKDMAEKDRPRERLMAEGAEALSSAELVAILLRTGRQGFSAVDIARQLLARFQSLDRLARATVEELRGIKGIGRDKAIALKSALHAGATDGARAPTRGAGAGHAGPGRGSVAGREPAL